MTAENETMDDERAVVAWAAEIDARMGEHSARHERGGTFVTEAYDVHPLTPGESLVHAGLVALGLPADER